MLEVLADLKATCWHVNVVNTPLSVVGLRCWFSHIVLACNLNHPQFDAELLLLEFWSWSWLGVLTGHWSFTDLNEHSSGINDESNDEDTIPLRGNKAYMWIIRLNTGYKTGKILFRLIHLYIFFRFWRKLLVENYVNPHISSLFFNPHDWNFWCL